MKTIILAALLISAPIPAIAQEVRILNNHPMEWQIPDKCSTEITTRVDNDKAGVGCSKVIFSTSTKTHNINFVATAKTTVSFVTEIGSNNKTLNVIGVAVWSEGKPTVLSAEGECRLMNKGDRFDDNDVAVIDMIGCGAKTEDFIFQGAAGFVKLQSQTARRMFR
jgi:hypothetical protein